MSRPCWTVALVAATMLPLPAAGADLVIRGGWLFDAVGDDVVPNRGLVIEGGKLLAVGADLEGRDLGEAAVLELSDEDYVVPGLFDLHAHYNLRVMGWPRTDETEHYSVIYLASGCTSTFPAGEYNPRAMLEMRRRIDRGEQVGPRVYSSGPYFGLGMRRSASAEEVRAQVDEWAALGARGFKAKAINPIQLEALIERAHWHGLTVTAHLDSGYRGSVNPKDAILMGIDRVEHFLGGDLLPDTQRAYASLRRLTEADLDTPAFREIVQLYIDHDVSFDATLTAYGYGADDEVFEQWTDESKYLTPAIRAWRAARPPPRREGPDQFIEIFQVKQMTVKRFFDAGGRITLGTDHVCDGTYLAGFAAHREMHALARTGIPPAAVLKIATINGARALNVSELLGTIEPGKLADLFVTRGNPLEDIRNTRHVHTVVKGGRVYRTRDLLASVEGKVGPAAPPG